MTTPAEELERRVAEGVAVANIPTLLMVLVQLTGDLSWLQDPYTVRRSFGVDDNDTGGLEPAAMGAVRAAATRAITSWLRTGEVALARPSDELLVTMLSASMGEPVAPAYGPMLAYDLDLVTRAATCPDPTPVSPPQDFQVVVIGAGAGGICAAVRLQEAGIPYTVVERAEGVGGVWEANHYPGAGVDTPNHLYSFTFAPHDWTRYFVLRDELYDYLQDVVRRFDLAPHLRLRTEVQMARYDADGQCWELDVAGPGGTGTLRADVVIAASGLFNPPKLPDIEGLEDFPGVKLHTAEWDDTLDVRGKRVAVVGSGASAMQCVCAIADDVASLTIFQRSPTWAAPFEKFEVPVVPAVRALFDAVPLYRAWYRLRLNFMWSDRLLPSIRLDPDWPHPERSMNATNDRHRQYFTNHILSEIGERPDLIDKVVPRYPPYGKRILLDNGWYRTVARPHVTLVDDPIVHIGPDGVSTASGERHDPEILILATGFDVQRFLSTFEVVGRDGVTLRDVWGDDDARAYLGTAVPGFPNLFCLYGPNSQSGAGGSIIALLEAQVNYAMSVITQMIDRGVGSVECRREVHDEYNRRLDDILADSVWTHPAVSTYYRNARGRVTVNSGLSKLEFWTMTREADLGDYHLEPAADRPNRVSRDRAT